MDRTKVAVVGLGGIAQLYHIPILSSLKNIELTAVADINKNRLKSVGEKFGIKKQYTDYMEMLDREEFDAAVIATPTNTHLEIALECLKNKKDVLIEKPIARNYAEAKEILAAGKKYKKTVMIGMNLRYRPDAMLMKSLISSGDLGEIFYIRCGWLRKQSSDEKWFFNKNQSGGGVIIDLGILLLDLSLWMMDDYKIKSASVQKYNHNTKDVEDSAIGLIRLENDRIISFEVSWGLHSEWDKFHLAAFGTRGGTAHLNPLRAYKRLESSHIDYTLSNTTNPVNMFKKSYENELKHFIGAVRENNSIISSADDAASMMKLLEALYKSAELKKEVNL
jgi:predicted dehydrogenase